MWLYLLNKGGLRTAGKSKDLCHVAQLFHLVLEVRLTLLKFWFPFPSDNCIYSVVQHLWWKTRKGFLTSNRTLISHQRLWSLRSHLQFVELITKSIFNSLAVVSHYRTKLTIAFHRVLIPKVVIMTCNETQRFQKIWKFSYHIIFKF